MSGTYGDGTKAFDRRQGADRQREGEDAGRCRVNICDIDLERLRAFLSGQEDFLVRLLENPILPGHQEFTALLQATVHMTGELAHREDFGVCPPPDMTHLEGDIPRVYGMLVTVWRRSMQYLKTNYPYLFSLAMRTNPFDASAPVMVIEQTAGFISGSLPSSACARRAAQ